MANTELSNIMKISEEVTKPVQYLNLNLRERFTPFNIPAVEELSAALNDTLPDQQGMIFHALRGEVKGFTKSN